MLMMVKHSNKPFPVSAGINSSEFSLDWIILSVMCEQEILYKTTWRGVGGLIR